ncbi:BlaI/MecI/CopY family transcriptional regulator [Microbacterium sp. RD1]|uniref:BlaI/MecI/CopY family transcriptional regulator n=1 Tax=Microbacterium sp. RD1 TaxID=3457313 RepID=UPI003FA578D4
MAGERTRERGELEGQILRILRAAPEPLGARQIQEAFSDPVPAHTTLLTALDRLHKKGEVVRAGISPRKQSFRAAHSDDEHAGASMLAALDDAGDRRAALLRFAGNLEADDLALLRAAIDGSSKGKRH